MKATLPRHRPNNLNNHFRVHSKWMVLMAFYFLSINPAFANRPDCGSHCFDTRIVSVNDIEGCKEYTLKVSYSGECRYYGLSHFTVGVPCGEVAKASNSEGWPMELNMTDPTTGVYGFKVDDIEGFGEGNIPQEFMVKFTICPNDANCVEELACWAPTVTYKSGQCVDQDTLELTCNTLSGTLVPANESCFGENDGSATVTIEGGKAPFSYLWSNGSTAPNLEGVSAGEYSVTITDANGQEIILQTTIEGPKAIAIGGTTAEVSCSGVDDGSISLIVEGGNAPYSYVWSNGETTQNIENLAAGAYNVKVTDANGCTASDLYVLRTSESFSLRAYGSTVACGENGTGTIDLTVIGGAAPYTINWSNGATTEDLQNLDVGSYTVTVTDANGCTGTAYARVREESLGLKSFLTRPTCKGATNGSIDITMTSGVAPYTFSWSNGQTSEDISGLPRGIYTVTVTDAKGCDRTASFYVSEPQRLSSDISLKDFQCEGTSATLDLSIAGGTSPYTVLWSSGETTEDIAISAEDIYQVTITDASGCTAINEFNFEMSEQPLALSYVKTDLNCNGSIAGIIDLTVSGGKAPYTYNWSNGSRNQDLYGLSGGTYAVTVNDAYGCTVSASLTIEEPAALGCTIINPSIVPVPESSGNTLSTGVTGAVKYEWQVNGSGWTIDSGQGSAEVTYTAGIEGSSATFTLTITYSGGCTETCSISIQSTSNDENNPGNGDTGGGDPGDGDTGEGDTGDTGNGDTDNGDPGDDGSGNNPGDSDDNGDTGDGDSDNGDQDGDDAGDTDNGESGDDDSDGNDVPGDGDVDDGDTDNGNPGDDGNKDKACTDCFDTNIVSSSLTGECKTYTMKITSDGLCRYDLSHFTVAIPCGKVSNISNSEGWKIEYGKDPTTGLYGLKIDDVPEFGKEGAGESFKVTFTLCPDDVCENKLSCWEPVVAYKAGQCIFYDDVEATCKNINQRINVSEDAISSVAYPNPFVSEANIEFSVSEETQVRVELYSIFGDKVATLFNDTAEKFVIYNVKIDGSRFTDDLYIYKIISSKGVHTGKILRN